MADKKPLVLYGADVKELASTDTIPITNGGVDQTAWTSYTPTWTGITIGNAVVDAKYRQIGKTVFVRIDVTFGTTTSTSGGIQSFTLPVNSVSRINVAILGRGRGLYSTVEVIPIANYKTASDVYLGYEVSGGGAGTANGVVFTALAWASTYKLSLELVYEGV